MKGGGHGRGITTRGRAVGVRGINRPVGVPVVTQRVATGPQAATTGGLVVRGAGQTRLNVRGTQRGKPQPNLPGEKIRSLWNHKMRSPPSVSTAFVKNTSPADDRIRRLAILHEFYTT